MYLGAIVGANLLVNTFGPGISIATSFVFIGLDLTSRDYLHKRWEGRGLVWKMGLLILAGSLLSWVVNRDAGRIALASFLAFAVSASIDALCYSLLRENSYLVRVNGSNVFGAAADSLLFPWLAFPPPLLPWVVFGQFVAKVGGGFLWSMIIKRLEAK